MAGVSGNRNHHMRRWLNKTLQRVFRQRGKDIPRAFDHDENKTLPGCKHVKNSGVPRGKSYNDAPRSRALFIPVCIGLSSLQSLNQLTLAQPGCMISVSLQSNALLVK